MSDLTEIINRCMKKKFYIENSTIRFPSLPPWWTKECQELIDKRKKIYRNFYSHQSTENYILYKKNDAEVKKRLHEIRRQGRKTYLSQLDIHNMNKNWSVIRQYKKACFPVNKDDNNATTFNWLKDFLNIWTPDSVSEFEKIYTDDLNFEPFLMFELKKIILKLPNTSPGLDGISYTIIKSFPRNVLEYLLKFYNNFLTYSLVPNEWKDYDIVPILKPGKPGFRADSYRPIGKISCLAKVFEHLCKLRLEKITNKLIPSYSMGFRKGYSTNDCLNIFILDIYRNLTHKKHTLALFLDINRAYDSVILSILWKKMKSMKIPSILIRFLRSYYNERNYYCTYKGTREGPRRTSVGLPQGAVLSPILFLIYTADLRKHIDSELSVLQYADDFLFYIHDKNISVLNEKMNENLDKISRWLEINAFSASEEKSQLALFSRNRINYDNIEIYLNKKKIQVMPVIKYLGVFIDNKLKMSFQIECIKNKVLKSINFLKALTTTWWGADPEVLLLTYKSIILSIIDYGCSVYGNASRSTLKILDKIQFAALRVCIGCMRSTPTKNILVEAGQLPLKLRRQMITNNYYLKVIAQNKHDVFSRIQSLDALCNSQSYWTTKSLPILVKSHNLYSQYNILENPEPYIQYQPTHFPTILTNVFNKIDFQYQNPSVVPNILSTSWPSFRNVIYTDASKKKTGEVGAAFFDTTADFGSLYSIPKEYSIFSAEAYALLMALEYIEIQEYENVILCTDALSLCEALKNQTKHQQR